MEHPRKVWTTVIICIAAATVGQALRSPAWWSFPVILESFDFVIRCAAGMAVIVFAVVLPTFLHTRDVIRGVESRIRGDVPWTAGLGKMILDLALTVGAVALILAPIIALLR